MPIVEFDGPPSWSLDASETGKSTKCPWVAGGEVDSVHHFKFVASTIPRKNREL